jgi:dihydroorotase
MAEPSIWLQNLQLLSGPGAAPASGDALIGADGTLLAIGDAAAAQARVAGLSPSSGSGAWLAPALVDPHSVLEDPSSGRAETLTSLGAAAVVGGYGTVALLPWAHPWRDSPERLVLPATGPLDVRLWGSFSRGGDDTELAPHGDQLEAGAIGLACGDHCPPVALLERGLRLAEQGEAPLLVAPRDPAIAAGGFVREGADALRAGWPPDPVLSETLPLQSLLALAAAHRPPALRLMNLSTAEGASLLAQCPVSLRPLASVSWWHLLADAARLDPTAEGWRVVPSLGSPVDRQALIAALASGVIGAVAVHHLALDAEERLLPLDQRRGGLAGHGAVLPLLWQELVGVQGWSVAQLWQALCWGPARFLGITPPLLEPGTRQWVLFDPQAQRQPCGSSLAANQPAVERWLPDAQGRGGIRAGGLIPQERWTL